MFAAKAGTNYDGVNIPSLAPGIYKDFKLEEVKKDVTTPQGDKVGTAILTFLFIGKEGAHQHTEYDIKADDPKVASKSESMVKRMGHILRTFGVPQATLDAMPQHASFDAYVNWIIATIPQTYKTVNVDLKIVGNVYGGKATAGFPGYIPFLASGLGGTKSLSFSNNETAQNAQYAAHYNSTPDKEASSGASVGTESRDTDF